eukprot:scaffold22805_cov59-Phaeocystis_antarctica.AAC.6
MIGEPGLGDAIAPEREALELGKDLVPTLCNFQRRWPTRVHEQEGLRNTCVITSSSSVLAA